MLIAKKLIMIQPAAGEHLKVLAQAGLIEGQRIKQWTFYRRNEQRIEQVKREFQSDW